MFFTDFLRRLSPLAKTSLGIGAIFILTFMVVSVWWLLRPNYHVLFSDLKPQDALSMTQELDRLKLPYELSPDGTSILMDESIVHSTRLKLMGRDVKLNGAVGLEIFNNSDFGMTEFSQKINYQRAIQGELTRTILSLSEIRDARVHLALPEQGLFKRDVEKAKASISLTLHPGKTLKPEQVLGIARLVSAAVPGMNPQEVTIVDNHGVTLTRPVLDSEFETVSARLDLKKETENHLSRKAGLALDKMFGPGQALAVVDVVLDTDQIRLTTEEVLPAAPAAQLANASAAPRGVIVKERESLRDVTPATDGPVSPNNIATTSRQPGAAVQREVDYQVGRRVEQVVSQPGSVLRIQAVALVRQPLSTAQTEQVRQMVIAAVGASVERGDSVVVQSYVGPSVAESEVKGQETEIGNREWVKVRPNGAPGDTAQAPSGDTLKSQSESRSQAMVNVLSVLLLTSLALMTFLGVRQRTTRAVIRAESILRPESERMTDAQRQAALVQIRDWLQGSSLSPDAELDAQIRVQK